ncbi:MAG: YggT family protein [Peptostreptococcus porci]|uniref:YggT family protein n=1 Tax=Peptostreptococcus porci TaxID=2652282 RepID=A0A6N7X197_9FIRM|nr:YggT family protein [Peptostreptococcus porci]MDD7183126.1 YggT family protein [Peptostreptococcus porci]MDY4129602.1 YggT family protein [Peptostreptococcus porci]MDY5479537.1 YggT family protein [Peptostreptococcus porci]MST61891.1 YggT family protein [Peptostreptococcus porci]
MEVLKIALIKLIDIIIWVVIAKSILSWFPGTQDSKFYRVLDDFTSPIEIPVRKIFGRFMTGPLDFTPMVVIIVLMIISRLVYMFL